MTRARRAFLALFALTFAALAGPASAQFPDRLLRLVVPFPPGGATDVMGRILARKMGEILGKTVVVENHPGAGGTIGTDFAARQPGDGYTLLLVNAIPHTASRSLYPTLKYDPVKSFTPIGALGLIRYILVVNNDVPAQDYAQFVAYAKANPGKLNFASAGVGSAPHLAMELWLRAAGVDMLHVPYAGSGPAMTDLMGGRVQAAMDNVGAAPHIKAGKLRALAITGANRAPAFPQIPTFAEVGLPSYDVSGTWGLIAPANVPDATVKILSDALAKTIADPEVRDALVAQGIEPVYAGAADYGAVLVRELDKWTRLIDQAKIKL
ncbi:MAG: Bug family tripartite tricarboxylate transporter substrate binding protein [Vicinamibacteria bacterium]|jgi:tripartite-type tricarboxylate transporter receptor subunit TctC